LLNLPAARLTHAPPVPVAIIDWGSAPRVSSRATATAAVSPRLWNRTNPRVRPHPLHRTPAEGLGDRITGTDFDAIPRYHFRAKTDKIVEAV
jgi:hypothetical protein